MDYTSFAPGQSAAPQTSPPIQTPQMPSSSPEGPRKTFSPKLIIALVVILLLAGGAYGAIWWWGNQQTAQEIVATFTPRPTSDTTSWKTYTNTQYRFQFQYPSKFELGGGGDTISDPKIKELNKDLQDLNKVPGYIISDGFVSIVAFQPSNIGTIKNSIIARDMEADSKPVGTLLSTSDLRNPDSALNEVAIINGGIKFLKQLMKDYPDDSRFISQAVFHDANHNQIYIAVTYKDGESIDQIKSDPLFQNFNQILSTFKFITNTPTASPQSQEYYNSVRGANLSLINVGLNLYYNDKKRFPSSLSELQGLNYLPILPVDPETKQPYSYTLQKGGQGYLVCANFGTLGKECVSDQFGTSQLRYK